MRARRSWRAPALCTRRLTAAAFMEAAMLNEVERETRDERRDRWARVGVTVIQECCWQRCPSQRIRKYDESRKRHRALITPVESLRTIPESMSPFVFKSSKIPETMMSPFFIPQSKNEKGLMDSGILPQRQETRANENSMMT